MKNEYLGLGLGEGCPGVVAVASSAARSGSFCFFGVRRSARSCSAFVAVAGFSSRRVASRFAAVWGSRIPHGWCCVRPRPFGWGVSVPVAVASVPAAVLLAGRGRVSASGSPASLVAAALSWSPVPSLLPVPVAPVPVPAASLRSRVFARAWSWFRAGCGPFGVCLRRSWALG